jgi:hypothetical protein
MFRILLTTLVLVLLAGCDKPPPDPEAPPDPQATALRDTIQEPIDKAKGVEAADAQRDAERQKALEEAGG